MTYLCPVCGFPMEGPAGELEYLPVLRNRIQLRRCRTVARRIVRSLDCLRDEMVDGNTKPLRLAGIHKCS